MAVPTDECLESLEPDSFSQFLCGYDSDAQVAPFYQVVMLIALILHHEVLLSLM